MGHTDSLGDAAIDDRGAAAGGPKALGEPAADARGTAAGGVELATDPMAKERGATAGGAELARDAVAEDQPATPGDSKALGEPAADARGTAAGGVELATDPMAEERGATAGGAELARDAVAEDQPATPGDSKALGEPVADARGTAAGGVELVTDPMAKERGATAGGAEPARDAVAEDQPATPGDSKALGEPAADARGTAAGGVELVTDPVAKERGATAGGAELARDAVAEDQPATPGDSKALGEPVADARGTAAGGVELVTDPMAKERGATAGGAELISDPAAEEPPSGTEPMGHVVAEDPRAPSSRDEPAGDAVAESRRAAPDSVEPARDPLAEARHAGLAIAEPAESPRRAAPSKRRAELTSDPVDHRCRYRRDVGLARGPKRPGTEIVDHARDAVRMGSDARDRVGLEHNATVTLGPVQLVRHVAPDFGGRQRGEQEAHRGIRALSIEVREPRGEPWLAHKQHRYPPAGVSPGRRESAEPGERQRFQALRLVDRHDGRAPQARGFHGDRSVASRVVPRAIVDTHLPSERGEHSVQVRRIVAPEDLSTRRFQVAGHSPQHHRLPCPRLAGQQDQVPVRPDCGEEFDAHGLVDRARVEASRIGDLPERVLAMLLRYGAHRGYSRVSGPLAGPPVSWCQVGLAVSISVAGRTVRPARFRSGATVWPKARERWRTSRIRSPTSYVNRGSGDDLRHRALGPSRVRR